MYGVRKTTFDKIHFKSMTNYQELCNVHPFTVANWFLISLLDLFHKVNTNEVQTYVWRYINMRSCIIYYDVLHLSSVKFPRKKFWEFYTTVISHWHIMISRIWNWNKTQNYISWSEMTTWNDYYMTNLMRL